MASHSSEKLVGQAPKWTPNNKNSFLGHPDGIFCKAYRHILPENAGYSQGLKVEQTLMKFVGFGQPGRNPTSFGGACGFYIGTSPGALLEEPEHHI